MAVVSRIATLVFSNGLGSSMTFQATAAVQDTAAGGSVVISVVTSTAGATPPALPDTYVLNLYNDNGTLIRAFTLSSAVGTQNVSFFFTANGQSGGGDRAGTVEIALRATKTTGGPTTTYDAETDGSPATAPTTFTITQADRGWIRGTTTAVQTLSNIALGGAKSSPAAYTTPVAGDGGDSLFVRTTLGAATFVARPLTVAVSGATPALSVSTTSSVGPVHDATFARVVDNRFPASATTTATSVTVPNATLTGQPATVLTTTVDSMSVDPRLTRTPLFQLDDNTFGTPPLIKDIPDHRRLTSQQGFLASRTTNSRGEGVNGVTYTVSLTPRSPGTPATQSGLVTTTQGGQTGWAPSFLAWSAGLPGGTWDKSATYTAPADITGASYSMQAPGTSLEYFLIARNDDLILAPNVQHQPGFGGRHFISGMILIPTCYLVNLRTGVRIPAADLTDKRLGVVRVATPANPDGTGSNFEYLDATETWVSWGATARTFFSMTTSVADNTVLERLFVTTSAWELRDIRFVFSVEYQGVTYAGDLVVINVDGKNRHDGHSFDPTGLYS